MFEELALAIFFVDFWFVKCVFVSRPMKIVTFLRKSGDPPKRVVDFLLERDTFRNKIMEMVEDFACEAKNFHFFIFLNFPFFHFFFFSGLLEIRFLSLFVSRFLVTFLSKKKTFV